MVSPDDNSAALTSGLRVGDVLARKYRVERVLGVGGMGVVVCAYHLQLEERVAIKLLLPEVANNVEAVGRFAREAKAVVKIKSEHVARVIDVGSLESGAPYIVMEYLEGEDLHSWLTQRGVLTIEQAVEFLLQSCEAIAEAHALGIVHRDLKPANLFCVRRPDGVLSIKVLDFGISKLSSLSPEGRGFGATKTSAIMGSPLYMSPEQLQSSRDVDTRADIWSLGAILYELLVGHPPFSGETFPDLCINIVNSRTPLIRASRPEVPTELEKVICKCLEKHKEQRYFNLAQLCIELAPFAPKRARASVERICGIIQSAGLSSTAMVLPPSSDPSSPTVDVKTEATWGVTTPPKAWPTRRLLMLAGGATAVTLGVVLWGGLAKAPNRQVTNAALLTGQSETRSTALSQLDNPKAAPTVAASSGASILVIPEMSASANAKVALAPTGIEGVNPTNPVIVSSGTRDMPLTRTTTLSSGKVRSKGATTKPNCDPPYELDAEGNKHFKSTCY